MNKQSRLLSIIRSMVVTEKSVALRENGYLVFKVATDANKFEIKEAVEALFNKKVAHVRTLNQSGKTRRTIHGYGRRSDYKKAYVKFVDAISLEEDFESIADGTSVEETK